jgi:hypothetical protein
MPSYHVVKYISSVDESPPAFEFGATCGSFTLRLLYLWEMSPRFPLNESRSGLNSDEEYVAVLKGIELQSFSPELVCFVSG